MRYEVITDKDGYVQIIRRTGTPRDFVELNVDDYDFQNGRIHYYKLGKNQLIFDEEKWNQSLYNEEKANAEKLIVDLKQQLTDTDYIMARAFEEVLALKSPLTFVADIIKILVKYSTQYKDTIAKRVYWRNRIKELEDKYGR